MSGTTSLLQCKRCGFTTGDATPSRKDGVPRCPPCERRTDHERRLADGDAWYLQRIVDYAQERYGPDWEQQVGWDHCVALFGDARAVGGWAMVGVEMRRPQPRVERTTIRPCPTCGFETTSVSNYLCARCHFGGWWGRCIGS